MHHDDDDDGSCHRTPRRQIASRESHGPSVMTIVEVLLTP